MASRLERFADELREFYGLLPTPPADPFALFVWELLSFQSAPQKRTRAFASLKRHRALTPDSMSKIAQKKLEDSVRLAGPPFEQRLRALRTGMSVFQQHPDLEATLRKPLPIAKESLNVLPYMADGGADRMLLFAGGHRVLPMDAGTTRVVRRLGFEEAPDEELPHSLEVYRRVSIYLTHHAASTCTESDPHCGICPLRDECPSAQLTQ